MIAPYFLPYQQRWLNDTSSVKIWEKSRRIGATYTQSYEDVRDALSGAVKAVWFSSADESAAKEYILYCLNWSKMFALAGGMPESELIAVAQTNSITFTNGSRINALSSNPKGFRSKGGKVVLDEFAHHRNQTELWKAARPAVTWGFPVRIISTHNGSHSLFLNFTDAVKTGKRKWSLHTTDIYTAAQEGLVGRILKARADAAQTEAFLQSLRTDCFDETAWLEEYCCIPVDEKSAFLSYSVISACSGPVPEYEHNNYPLAAGIDIGRKEDATVIWVLALTPEMKYTVAVTVLKGKSFSEQKAVIDSYCRNALMQRVCIDATGLGMQLAEELKNEYGAARIEPVTFTAKLKEELAFTVLRVFEEKTILIPASPEIADDLHSIRKEVTTAGNTRLTAERINGSHGDRFWALALALHAAGKSAGAVRVCSTHKRSTHTLHGRY